MDENTAVSPTTFGLFWGHTELNQKKGSKRLHSCPFLPQESISYINVVQAIARILGQLQCMSFE
jgi:hypothetical protein